MITIGLNALDGFDVLPIGFASPGMAEEWGLNPGSLGIVLANGAAGYVHRFGPARCTADKVGCKLTILGSLARVSSTGWSWC